MKTFKKITAVFLATVFLFSSLGFTISSMVCLKSGKGKVSLFVIEDCCAKKKTVAVDECCDDEEQPSPNRTFLKKGDCCDINNYPITLKDYHVSQELLIEQPAAIHSLFTSSSIINVSASEHMIAFHAADLPPPLHGRTLLNFISILTI